MQPLNGHPAQVSRDVYIQAGTTERTADAAVVAGVAVIELDPRLGNGRLQGTTPHGAIN